MAADNLNTSLAEFGRVVFLFAPLVLSGSMNMLLAKTRWFERLNTPLDGGRIGKSGKRLLGSNKTWKGFWGMCVFSAISVWLFEQLAHHSEAINRISLFPNQQLKPPFDSLFWGFA